MTTTRFQDVEQIFHEARARRPEERAAFLDGACRGDLELRAEVESLLAHGGEPRAASPASEDAAADLAQRGPLQEGPGTRIGPYKLLQLIGEGGFGTVYMAEQKEPVRRRVALKIIKLGMDTRQVIARFEAERQALAMMDHPNIAKVLDAGATETGRPYFVMELVKGIPITDFCDQHHLATKERLALFVKVCRAIQHAHQKGIIHRDLKPSNVMVTLHDGEPVPKVIDFGIAKATNQELTEKTLFTQFRQFIGTPEYMSPEQTEISGLDIDTRSDIYSLGVLLYELLTGTTPVDRQRLRSSAFDEMKRLIREEEAVRPSTKVSTLGKTIGPLARARGEEPGALVRALRGDLDWIVLKALEKDRARRYETASDLAADIERHARHEPVQASPPSRVYRMRKFLRRNRGPVAAAAALGGVLVLGVAGTASGYVRATAALHVAEEQRDVAQRSEDRAVAEAEKQEALARFFQETLFAASPTSARGASSPTVEDLLRAASRRLESGALADQPLSLGIVHRALGDAYRDRELDSRAVAHYTRAAEALGDGAGDPLTFSHVARLLDFMKHDEIPAFDVELDTDALRAAAVEGLEPLLAVPDREAALELFEWASVLFATRRYADAEPLLDRLLGCVRVLDDRLVPVVDYARAGVLMGLGRREEARPMYERVREAMKRGFEAGDPALDFHMLAIEFWDTGGQEAVGWDPAEMEETIDRLRRSGAGTLEVLGGEGALAWTLWESGRQDEALERMRATVATARGFEQNQSTLGAALACLGIMLYLSGSQDESFTAFEEAKRRLAGRRGQDYYEACMGVALGHRSRFLELVDTDPAAAGGEVRAFLENLGEALSWEPEDISTVSVRGPLQFFCFVVSSLEGVLEAWERIDPMARRHPAALSVQGLVHEWIPRFLEVARDPDVSATDVNNLVWRVLALGPLEEEDLATALALAAKVNDETEYRNSNYLDTLARAWFLSGEVEAAVDVQREAVEIGARSTSVQALLEARLAEYEAALEAR